MSDQDLFKTLTTLHLTQEEKRFMRQNVLLHARERGVLSPITSFFMFSRSFVSVTAMALLLLVGTTVVHGAERALPGDTLYPMKRGVNERVLGVFARSDDAKARLETKFVDRRLEEIQKIIVQEDTQDIADSASIGEQEQELSISPETLAIVVSLTEEVQHHAKMAEEHIEKVSDNGSADDALVLASKLESSIDVHTSTIATLTVEGGEDDTLVAIAEAVQVLADSSLSVGELGDTIAVAIVADTSIVDKEKAEGQLHEAEELLALYIEQNPIVVTEDATIDEVTMPANEISIDEAVLTVDAEVSDSSVVTTSLVVEDTARSSSDETVIALVSPAVGEETVSGDVIEVEVSVDGTSTPTIYVLPTIEEVQAQIAECKVFIDTADYANAYITCTDALQSISTLTQVQEKTSMEVVVKEETSTTVSTSETDTALAADEDAESIKEKVKEKVEVSQKENLDASTLTGKVLDAFDQVR